MTEIPEAMRRDLARLSAQAGPPAGAQARVLAALELSGPPPEFELDPDPGLEPGLTALESSANASNGAQLLWGLKVAAATLALTAGGLLGVRGAVLAAQTLRSDPPPITAPVDDTPEATATRQPAAVLAPAPSAEAPTVDPEASTTGATTTTPPRESQPHPALKTPPSTSASASAETLAAELALLDAARQTSDPHTALARLQQHEQRFPAGALALERELLWVEALCELDDHARARSRFLALPPTGASPQRARLLELCPELSQP